MNGDFDFKSCKKIALMGGAFDPIHYGHLVTAQTVYDNFDVDRVVIMPLGNAPHKEMKGVSALDRYEMAKRAVCDNTALAVSAMEIERQGKTYTVDTVAEIKKINPKMTVYFVMGADEILSIDYWKEPERLLKMCSVIAVTRPGFDKKRVMEKTESVREKYGCEIYFLEVPALDISSSDIRDRLREGKSAKYLLPDQTLRYIEDNHLYK